MTFLEKQPEDLTETDSQLIFLDVDEGKFGVTTVNAAEEFLVGSKSLFCEAVVI